MRHRKQGRGLGRNASHRKAMLANLATAVLERERVKTTTAKAKEARGVVERLITVAKKDDLHARRQVLRTVRDRSVVTKLFDTIAPRYTDRPGGYTRIIHVGQRQGDAAEISILELVGVEAVAEVDDTVETAPTPKKRKKAKAAPPVAEEAAVEEAVVEEISDTVEDAEELAVAEEVDATSDSGDNSELEKETPSVEAATPEETAEAASSEESGAEGGDAEASNEDKDKSTKS